MSSIIGGTTGVTFPDGTTQTTAATQTNPAGSTGQVQYNNAGAFGAISSGTSGQVLTSQGSGSAPTWATPSSGAMVLIASATASNSAYVEFTSFSSTYQTYLLTIDNARCGQVNGGTLRITFKTADSGGDYLTSGISYETIRQPTNDSAYNPLRGSDAASIILADNYCSYTSWIAGYSGVIYMYNLSGTSYTKNFSFSGQSTYDNNVGVSFIGGGSQYGTTSNITALKVYDSSTNNLTSGTFKLYGLVNA